MSVERYASPASYPWLCAGCGIERSCVIGTPEPPVPDVGLSVDYGIDGLRRPILHLCGYCVAAIVEALRP